MICVSAHLTVYENIDYFCGLYVSDKKLREKYVKEAMDFVDIEIGRASCRERV